MSRLTRRLPLALVLATALVASGCGNKTDIVTHAETEGIYLDLGGMKYQIQMSRYMNISDVEDRGYLLGLPAGTQPAANEVWFGIWMRVQNESDKPLQAATDYEISDTQGNVYRPVPLDPKANPFAYEGGTVGPRSLLPLPDSASGNGPIQGSLVLFKLKTDSLQNRPLVLKISSGPQGKAVTVDIDV
jgi:hypothetical protein